MSFDSIWKDAKGFTFSKHEEEVRCPFAEKFSEWTQELCTKVTNTPDIIAINQAKILLVDKYFEWRGIVPKSHRNRLSGGHICIFHIFADAYGVLRAIELSLTPPLLFIPVSQTPPPVPRPQIAGIFLGEVEDE